MGLDLSQEAIAYARERADEGALHNLRFKVRDLTVFHREVAEAAYDLVTAFDAIHGQARPDHVLVAVVSSPAESSLCRKSMLPARLPKIATIRSALCFTRSRVCIV